MFVCGYVLCVYWLADELFSWFLGLLLLCENCFVFSFVLFLIVLFCGLLLIPRFRFVLGICLLYAVLWLIWMVTLCGLFLF